MFDSNLLALDFLLKAKRLKISEQSFRNSRVFSMASRMRKTVVNGWSIWPNVSLIRTPAASGRWESADQPDFGEEFTRHREESDTSVVAADQSNAFLLPDYYYATSPVVGQLSWDPGCFTNVSQPQDNRFLAGSQHLESDSADTRGSVVLQQPQSHVDDGRSRCSCGALQGLLIHLWEFIQPGVESHWRRVME